MTTYFTADPHFGHRLVAELRGFDDPAEHDEHLIQNWRRVVQPGDTVWILGDLAVSSPWRALGIITGLPGRVHLISGNHDPVHPMHRDAHRYLRRYLDVFESVQPFARRKIAGEEVLLSHFPYDKDRHEARYTQYRLRDEGRWLLHGHTHEKYRREGREVHVGLDAWDLSPVSIDTIALLMSLDEVPGEDR